MPYHPRMIGLYLVLVVSATLNIFGTLYGFSRPAYTLISTSPLPVVLAVTNLLVLVVLIGHLLLYPAAGAPWRRRARTFAAST